MMTSRKKGVKVSVEESWRNKAIKEETNGGGGGGSGGLKLRDGGKASEEPCGGLVGGNEEHGCLKSEPGAREREAESKETENHTEQNSEGSNTYRIIRWGEKTSTTSPLVLASSFLFFLFFQSCNFVLVLFRLRFRMLLSS